MIEEVLNFEETFVVSWLLSWIFHISIYVALNNFFYGGEEKAERMKITEQDSPCFYTLGTVTASVETIWRYLGRAVEG